MGLLLKIDMMRWLAETEPQVEVLETWNNADNRFMIGVNELLGYASRVLADLDAGYLPYLIPPVIRFVDVENADFDR